MNFRLRLFLCVIFLSSATLASGQSREVNIAAASDLKFALDSIVLLFEQKSGTEIRVTYGSSGKLYEQITHGAPFDIFFSADRIYAQKLWQQGLAGEPVSYGKGRLVIWSRRLDVSLPMPTLLLQPGVKRIAIANPLHAPYGRRAEEALKYYKIHDLVKEKLVLGENISQAAQYVFTGAADVGIIALSLALSTPMKKAGGQYALVPEESHHRLDQAFVLLKRSQSSGVIAFRSYLASAEAKGVLRYFGFTVPTDEQ